MNSISKYLYTGIAVLAVGATSLFAQQNQSPAVKIIQPEVRDNAVIIPAAFWNENVADWLEVAISGRPSDFLHETLICIPTTQSDLIRAMHKIGFRNATDVAKNFEEFQQLRGDRALLLLEVTLNGKKETYLLEELMEFRGWGTSVGPLGFYFKGTAPGASSQPVITGDDGKPLSEVQRILMDDPQAALTFKGLQHASRSFLDFSLAYDDWLYPPLSFARNTAMLPQDVFNSNGKVPVTLIIKKVTEVQALEAVAQYWHDDAGKALARKLLPVAAKIDRARIEYPMLAAFVSREASRLAICEQYAVLDAEWVNYALRHTRFHGEVNDAAARKQAEMFVRHLNVKATGLKFQTAAAASRTFNQNQKREELLYQSQAQLAFNEENLEYWQDQKSQLDPKDDPRKDWVDVVNLQIELASATKNAAEVNLDVAKTTPQGQEPALTPERKAAARRLALAQLRLQLQLIKMEIARQQLYSDGDAGRRVTELKAQQAAIEEAIQKTAQ